MDLVNKLDQVATLLGQVTEGTQVVLSIQTMGDDVIEHLKLLQLHMEYFEVFVHEAKLSHQNLLQQSEKDKNFKVACVRCEYRHVRSAIRNWAVFLHGSHLKMELFLQKACLKAAAGIVVQLRSLRREILVVKEVVSQSHEYTPKAFVDIVEKLLSCHVSAFKDSV